MDKCKWEEGDKTALSRVFKYLSGKQESHLLLAFEGE